ncbi:MAG: hypothetical protein OJF60_003537 [Burkholderiaceae bacterium]|nr:MAG: hypothetical protein OJF60_003537 [Burkholderiaceae bacterium]
MIDSSEIAEGNKSGWAARPWRSTRYALKVSAAASKCSPRTRGSSPSDGAME